MALRPGGEVVTLESAKLACAGSIPAQASTSTVPWYRLNTPR